MENTISTTPISTTDLMTYDGGYKTDFDKFRDMSGLAQGAIIVAGVVTVAAAGYGIYKGVKYITNNKLPNNNTNPQMIQQPQQYYQNPMQQSAVNIQGQYATNENNQPTVSFQANSTPVVPQMQYQPQPQQYYRAPAPNGQVQDIPIVQQPQVQAPIYQQSVVPQAQ